MTDKGTDAPAKEAAQTEGFGGSADKVREAAKWIVAAFGALGAALIASLSLSNLGSLSGGDLGLALLGFVIGLAGTAIVIGSVSRVLTVSLASLSELSGSTVDSRAVALLEKNEAMLGGFESPEKLATTHLHAQKRRVDAYEKMLQASDKPTYDSNDRVFQVASRELELTSPVVERVLGLVALDQLLRRYGEALKLTALGVSIAALGVALFAYYGHGPEPNVEPQAAVADAPVVAVVDLNETGVQTFGDMLGKSCELDHLQVLALDSTGDSTDVVVLPGTGCEVRRLTVTPNMGIICPANGALSGSTTSSPPSTTASSPPVPSRSGHPGSGGVGFC